MSVFTIASNPPSDKEARRITRSRSSSRNRLKRKSEPFKCPKCKKVWQYKLLKSRRTANPEYLIHFPSYGCTEYICMPCKRLSQGQ